MFSQKHSLRETPLFVLGSLSVLVGVIVILASALLIAPKLSRATSQLSETLDIAERAVVYAENGVPFFFATLDSLQSLANLAQPLPQTLATLRGTLSETASALTAAASSVKETKESAPGVLLPKGPLSAGVVSFRKTSEQLHLLIGMLSKMQPPLTTLGSDTQRLAAVTSDFRKYDPSEILADSRDQIITARARLTHLPTFGLALGLGALLGGFYLFLGALAIAAALSLRGLRLAALEPETASHLDKRDHRGAA